MNSSCFIPASCLLALLAAPGAASAVPSCAKGALVGAAAGVLARHPILGAAAGCAAGHYMAVKQAAQASQVAEGGEVPERGASAPVPGRGGGAADEDAPKPPVPAQRATQQPATRTPKVGKTPEAELK